MLFQNGALFDSLNVWQNITFKLINAGFFYSTVNCLLVAKKMIFDAKNAGAHAVKFQSYKASKIAAVNRPAYWDLSKESTKSQYELFSKYDSFTESDYIDLHNYCKKINIDFMDKKLSLLQKIYIVCNISFYWRRK